MNEATQKPDDLTPGQVAQLIGHSRPFVLKLIKAHRIAYRDERSPESTLPRYRIPRAAVAAWQASCAFPAQGDELVQTQREMAQQVGAVRLRIDRRHAARQRRAGQDQTSLHSACA